MDNIGEHRDVVAQTGCVICGKPTIRSHLLPKALALDARENQPHLLLGSLHAPGRSFSQGGIFDDNLLCNDHERKLQAFDTYAVDFCRNFAKSAVKIGDGIGFSLSDFDSDLLVRFAISVIWRYARSDIPFADSVQIDTLQEERLKIISFNNAPCIPDPTVVIWKYKSIEGFNVDKLIFPPSKNKFSFRHFWSFVVSGIAFNVKVDNRPLPMSWNTPYLNGNKSYIGIYKTFEGSPEHQATLQMAANMRLPRGLPKREVRGPAT